MMARVGLNPSNPALQLDDDLIRGEIPAQLPALALLQRQVVGRTEEGNRLFDWVVLGEMLTVSYTERQLAPVGPGGSRDDVVRYRCQLVALWDDPEVLDPVDLGVRIVGNDGDFHVFKVTEWEQNGFRITLTGERHE
jgi:hypothetical protein